MKTEDENNIYSAYYDCLLEQRSETQRQDTIVVSDGVFKELKSRAHPASLNHLAPPLINSFFGLPLHCKSDQKTDFFVIGDRKLAMRYLSGVVSEEELVDLLVDEGK